MKVKHLHLAVSQITNVCLYLYALSIVHGFKPMAAYVLSGLLILNFLAKELYIYELYKEEKELIKDFDAILNRVEKKRDKEDV